MKYTFLFACLLTLSSCAPKHLLNAGVIQTHQLTSEDLTRIQFYNTQDIVLTRYATVKSEKQTTNGNLEVVSGKQLEQVIIKPNTPGRVIRVIDQDQIAVSFEEGDNRWLVFGRTKTDPTYRLQASKWNNGRGVIQYGDQTFYTNTGAGGVALAFRMKSIHSEQRKVTVAGGSRVQ